MDQAALHLQASAAANSQAWAAAEASLTGRLNDAEAAAAGAGEREKRAWEKVQAANTRLAASAAALDAVKAELTEVDAGMSLNCNLACSLTLRRSLYKRLSEGSDKQGLSSE